MGACRRVFVFPKIAIRLQPWIVFSAGAVSGFYLFYPFYCYGQTAVPSGSWRSILFCILVFLFGSGYLLVWRFLRTCMLRRGEEPSPTAGYMFFLWFVLGFFIPDTLIGESVPPGLAAGSFLLVAFAFTFLCFLFFSPRHKNIFRFLSRAHLWFFILFIAYFLFFLVINLVRHVHLGFCHQNSSLLLQSLWNMARGDIFEGSLWQGGYFSSHFAPFLFLLLVPYLLIPSFHTIAVFTLLSVSSAAFPFFLLAKEKLGRTTAFGVVFVCMFHQSFYGAMSYELFLEQFLLPVFSWAMYFFLRRRFTAFLVCCFCAVGIREDVGLTVFLFGVLALFWRRKAPWVLFPMVLGGGWFFFSVKVLPFFIPDLGRFVGSHFSHLGVRGYGELALFLLNPWNLLKACFSMHAFLKLEYVFLLLLPFLFVIPFLASPWLLASAQLLENFTSSLTWTFRVDEHYSLPVFVFFAFSFILGLERIYGIVERKARHKEFWKACIIISAVLVSFLNFFRADLYGWVIGRKIFKPLAVGRVLPHAASLSSGLCPGVIPPREYYLHKDSGYLQALRRALGKIPKHASCIVPRYLLIWCAERKYVIDLSPRQIFPEVFRSYEYILVDTKTKDPYTQAALGNDYIRSLPNDEFSLVFSESGVLLYKNTGRQDDARGRDF